MVLINWKRVLADCGMELPEDGRMTMVRSVYFLLTSMTRNARGMNGENHTLKEEEKAGLKQLDTGLMEIGGQEMLVVVRSDDSGHIVDASFYREGADGLDEQILKP